MALKVRHPDNFDLHLIVDKKPGDSKKWKGGVGFVTKNMLSMKLPPPSDETLITYCGPPGLTKLIKEWLPEMGYTDDMIYKF